MSHERTDQGIHLGVLWDNDAIRLLGSESVGTPENITLPNGVQKAVARENHSPTAANHQTSACKTHGFC